MAEPVTTIAILEAIAQAIDELSDFLFGSGHAGSCGAFREAFFATTQELLPQLQETLAALSQASHDPSYDPCLSLMRLQQTLSSLSNATDAGFDRFKGRNLLGMTAYATRLNNFIAGQVLWPIISFTVCFSSSFSKLVTNTLSQVQHDISTLQQQVGQQQQNTLDLTRRLAALEDLTDANMLRTIDMVRTLAQRLAQVHDTLAEAIAAGDNQLAADLLQLRDTMQFQMSQLRQNFNDKLAFVENVELQNLATRFDAALSRVQGGLTDQLSQITDLHDTLEHALENFRIFTPEQLKILHSLLDPFSAAILDQLSFTQGALNAEIERRQTDTQTLTLQAQAETQARQTESKKLAAATLERALLTTLTALSQATDIPSLLRALCQFSPGSGSPEDTYWQCLARKITADGLKDSLLLPQLIRALEEKVPTEESNL